METLNYLQDRFIMIIKKNNIKCQILKIRDIFPIFARKFCYFYGHEPLKRFRRIPRQPILSTRLTRCGNKSTKGCTSCVPGRNRIPDNGSVQFAETTYFSWQQRIVVIDPWSGYISCVALVTKTSGSVSKRNTLHPAVHPHPAVCR